MSTQTTASALTQHAVDWLIANAKAVPDDKLQWVPMGDGRTVIDQLYECASVNHHWAKMFEAREVLDFPGELYEQLSTDCTTIEAIVPRLRAETDNLKSVIEGLPDEVLAITITMPWGKGVSLTIGQWIFNCYENMIYHVGQISYIQTLYGDVKMH